MPTVFLSYRQTDDRHRQRVRAFGDQLRSCGIDVTLDQFFLDDNPGGPAEGWDKWSSDRALKSDNVLIIGSRAWFECFEKTQPPGTGLGAACEADDLRHRIYEAGGIINDIRVVLFDDADAAYIPGKLKRYHRFHADRDLANIVRWLGGSVGKRDDHSTPRTSVAHNLPALQPFFGREDELRKIADALDPANRTWGALIDGPGGMGKTTLAVRAAYDAPPDAFDRIVFVSLKTRELDDDGLRDLSGFLISGFAELFNELARELGHAAIAKAPEEQRPRMLLDSLRDTRTLLVLDNLESLLKRERDTVFTFVKRLPSGCKAILTSRGRIGSGAEELILEEIDAAAAMEMLATLADSNPALARTSEAERLLLYRQTGGKPLLLRWTAGQIGRGSCVTLVDALSFLRSCPEGNDPLEFIFGDLAEDFSEMETQVLCALTYFTLPARPEHIADVAGADMAAVDRALRSLVNRSLVVPSEEYKTFVLVPLVADYLRKRKPEVVRAAGDHLEQRAFVLAIENGDDHERFPVLETAWPTVAAALPRLVMGPNDRLQRVCAALNQFFEATGRWDEWLAVSRDAESRAVEARDHANAGWRAHDVGWVHFQRGQAAPLRAAAARADAHWREAQCGTREQAEVLRLYGVSYGLEGNHSASIDAFREVLELDRTLNPQSADVAVDLETLAAAKVALEDLDGAEMDYREALRIYEAVENEHGVLGVISNQADLALRRQQWTTAERMARDVLSRARTVRRDQVVGAASLTLAIALIQQGRNDDARPHAQQAVDIYGRLGDSDLEVARATLEACRREPT
jgi:tetratricopeptide (TPR) repeat protein